jgi:hypothetical protein
MAERRARVAKGAPLNWPDPVIPAVAAPALPMDADVAAAAFKRDARRKRPTLLEAVPDEK